MVRAFENDNVLHPEGEIDPDRDIELIETELILNDLLLVTSRLERIEERISKGGNPKEVQSLKQEQILLERILATLEQEQPLREMLSPPRKRRASGATLFSARNHYSSS